VDERVEARSRGHLAWQAERERRVDDGPVRSEMLVAHPALDTLVVDDGGLCRLRPCAAGGRDGNRGRDGTGDSPGAKVVGGRPAVGKEKRSEFCGVEDAPPTDREDTVDVVWQSFGGEVVRRGLRRGVEPFGRSVIGRKGRG
jgi:hypothetical protein